MTIDGCPLHILLPGLRIPEEIGLVCTRLWSKGEGWRLGRGHGCGLGR
jgi:hypothetical protein